MARNVAMQILRGIRANMPVLLLGEYYFSTDTNEHFIGTASGNFPLGIPVFNAAGGRQQKVHIVTGKVTLPGGGAITVTLAGGAIFTSAASYISIAGDTSATHEPRIVQNSGTSLTISGTGGDVINFICIGN